MLTPAVRLRKLGLTSRDIMKSIHQMVLRERHDYDPPWHEITDQVSPQQDTEWANESLQTFTCFGELPTEIRLKIWRIACSPQRNVDIFTETLGAVRVNHKGIADFEPYKFYSKFCRHPPLLHACRESREEGLNHYKLVFGTSHAFPNLNISTPPQIYVNFASDRLCLLLPRCFADEFEKRFQNFVDVCKQNRARFLAVNIDQDHHWPLIQVTTDCSSLEEVVLFDSTVDFDNTSGVEVGFGENEDLDRNEFLRAVKARELEDAKRDFHKLFELFGDGLSSQTEPGGGMSQERKESTWRPPVIEIRDLFITSRYAKKTRM